MKTPLDTVLKIARLASTTNVWPCAGKPIYTIDLNGTKFAGKAGDFILDERALKLAGKGKLLLEARDQSTVLVFRL